MLAGGQDDIIGGLTFAVYKPAKLAEIVRSAHHHGLAALVTLPAHRTAALRCLRPAAQARPPLTPPRFAQVFLASAEQGVGFGAHLAQMMAEQLKGMGIDRVCAYADLDAVPTAPRRPFLAAALLPLRHYCPPHPAPAAKTAAIR